MEHKAEITEWDPYKDDWTQKQESARLVPFWYECQKLLEDLFCIKRDYSDVTDKDEVDAEHSCGSDDDNEDGTTGGDSDSDNNDF